MHPVLSSWLSTVALHHLPWPHYIPAWPRTAAYRGAATEGRAGAESTNVHIAFMQLRTCCLVMSVPLLVAVRPFNCALSVIQPCVLACSWPSPVELRMSRVKPG